MDRIPERFIVIQLRPYQEVMLNALRAEVREWCIYVLRDPRDGAIRYVGWTKHAKIRLKKHIWCKDRSHKQHWINSVIADGKRPLMEIIEDGSGPGFAEAERRWIAHYRSIGCPLTNGTDGGEGALGLRHTEEAKRKSGEARRGKKLNLTREERERRGRQGIANLIATQERRNESVRRWAKIPKSEATRQALSRAHIGRVISAETRERCRIASSNRRHSQETIEKMRAKAMLRKRGPRGTFL